MVTILARHVKSGRFVIRIKNFLLALVLFSASPAHAEPFFPTSLGAQWEYEVSDSSDRTVQPAPVMVRISGTELIGSKEVLKLETLAGDEVIRTEFFAVEERGLVGYRRRWKDGRTLAFDTPQTLIPAPLRVGAKWKFDDSVSGAEMPQQWRAAAEEDVTVPAGTYRAVRLRCEQPWPLSMTIERWFVPGVGFIKDITTTRGPTGRLLSRVALLLTRFSVEPIPPSRPDPTAAAPSTALPENSPPVNLKLEVAQEREGEAVAEVRSDVPNIFVRWSGENLPLSAEVRIAWIAEDVGDVAPPNFVVDETRTTITRPDFAARFTLSRPKDGWAAGKYRVELYLKDELKEKVSVLISD